MSNIVNTLRGGLCEPNTGCMSIKMCICDLLGDAADKIERLRAADTELSILRSKLSATTHDCTDRAECALREVVWHLRAIL